MEYKRLIIEMLEKINDNKFLRRIYIIISDYIKEELE